MFSLSQLTETSDQLALTYSQLEAVTAEKESLTSDNRFMAEELSRSAGVKEEFQRQIEELRASVSQAEDETQEKMREKRQLEQQMEEMQVK